MLLAVVVGALALAAAALAFAVDRFGRRDGAGRADVIIVLGAKVLDGVRASPALRARVERGVALFHRGLAPRLLLSGGGPRGPPSEAEIMRRIAAAQGVPDGAILLEPESRNTAENAYLSAAMMRRHGFASAIVVSDPFHLLRARQWFRRAGVEVGTSPAPLSGRGFTRADRFFWTLREALALAGSPRLLLARPAVSRGERS